MAPLLLILVGQSSAGAAAVPTGLTVASGSLPLPLAAEVGPSLMALCHLERFGAWHFGLLRKYLHLFLQSFTEWGLASSFSSFCFFTGTGN